MINPVLLCNQKRVEELNNKIYNRNLTNAKIEMHESFRSVPTRQVHFPILDCNKPNNVNRLDNQYNVKTMFTPASNVPTQSYRDNIDIETKLRGTIFPIQNQLTPLLYHNITYYILLTSPTHLVSIV